MWPDSSRRGTEAHWYIPAGMSAEEVFVDYRAVARGDLADPAVA
jgi:hypothetical protein